MLRKYSLALQATGAAILASGGAFVVYQVYNTRNIVDGLLHTSAFDYEKKKVEYIYLNEPKIQTIVRPGQGEEVIISDDEPFILTSAFMRWWTAVQKSRAWRFFHVAKTGDRSERQRAVQSLAKLTVLTDSDYQMFAQMCDAQTAVGLARTKGSDLRFFLHPPRVFKKRLVGKELKEKLVELLQSMEHKHHHSCLDNFLSTYEHGHEDSPGVTLSPLLQEEIISKALDTLVHHCSISGHAEDLLTLGALPILMDLHYYFLTNLKMLSEIFTLLSYLSHSPNALPAFFMSGWVGVLAKWSRHSDACVALPCAKTLANLDSDSPDGHHYPDRIYPLHPTFRHKVPFKADVIFVHGLLGTVYVTWRQRDKEKLKVITEEPSSESSFWPAWLMRRDGSGKVADTKSETPETSHLETKQYMTQLLDLRKEDFESLGSEFEYVLADLPLKASRGSSMAYSLSGDSDWVRDLSRNDKYSNCWARDWLPKDVPDVRVLGINYTTTLSEWYPLCPLKNKRAKMADRSMGFMQMLHQVGVGQRPIIWITHSMGGLLVKHMLVSAYESGNKELQSIFRNTKAVVFFSCPHLGSELADLKMPTEMLFWPSLEVKELRYRSPALLDLHLRFLQLQKVAPISILSFGETKATNVTAMKLPINFVMPHSSDPGVGEFYELPLDHIDICKPTGRHSFLYRKVVDIINKVLQIS